MTNDAEPMDAKTLMEQDRLLDAVERARFLPDDHPDRTLIEEHAKHITSPETYRDYYRTMRGEPCPEEHIFRRHEQIKRFSVIRKKIVERGHKTVLDLGCLDGWQLLNLAATGVTGVGVDLCHEALAVGRERAVKWGFDLVFVECPIEEFGLREWTDSDGKQRESKFDAIILSEVLEHVLDPAACFKTAMRHLAPGGIVYVSVPATPIPHHGKLEDAREHLRVYTEADLVGLARDAGLARVVDHELLEERDEGQPFANRTISFRRATVCVYCNHVTGGWRPDRLDELGGSEEMVVKTAEAWARIGHAVTVHQNGYEGVLNGVTYLPRSTAPELNRDLLVLFKTTDYADSPAGATIFWTTDLPQPGASAQFLPPRVVERLDLIICISEYHRMELLRACPWLDPAKVKAHWLGVDEAELDRAREAVGPDQVDGQVIYASSYDRGLGFLLEQWPRVREAVPNAELHVTYGFDFWKRSEAVVPAQVAEGMRQERARLEKLLTQPGVTHLGRLPREAFLKEFAAAEVWAYPCAGGELCCKTALEAQLLGAYPVVVPTMALAETVQLGSKIPINQFTDELIRVLKEHPAPAGGLTIPSWNDLATWIWDAVVPVLIADQGVMFQEAREPIPPALTVGGGPEPPLPDRFPIPACSGPVPEIGGLQILMAVGGMPFDGTTDRERSLGGSETTAIQLSRELVKRGHSVTVFSNLPQGAQPGKHDGVTYMPIGEFTRYAGTTSHDVAIVQREPMGFNQPLQSKLNVLWCHDLGLRRYHAQFRSSLWNVDYVVPVSHWHGRQLCGVYGLPAETIAPMRNGIELETIRRHSDRKGARDPNGVVFTSRPERGLDVLVSSVFPRLLERNPRLVLYVAGYDNTTEQLQGFYSHIQQQIANLGQRAKWMGHLRKAELYGLYSRARCYLYPSRNFKEVSCLTAMEAAACGLPFVGTTLGALPETTGRAPGYAELVEHPGNEATEDFVARFVDMAWKVIGDDAVNKRMSEAGRAGAEAFSWVDVAREWEEFLYGAIELRSRDKLRLARYWWRLGDLNGLEQLIPKLSPDEAQAFGPKIWHDLVPDLPPPPPDHVLNAICQVAADAKAKTILGMGAHGPTAAHAIAKALNIAAVDMPPADFVFGFETLDCAPDPSVHIREAEALAGSGGSVCFVTATPGVQQDRLHRGAERRRRWVFDGHDLKELLGARKDLLAMVVGGGGLSAYDHTPFGWSVSRIRKGGGPVGTINWDRRLWLQSPRLSLSGCMIVKNGQGTLSRCLASIKPYCDEIVLDDNGSTDSTLQVARWFGVEPGVGPSPLEVGFDEARNQTIARATGDVVLWIDADEELLDPRHLPKYLRWSLFNGFNVAQHHFSAVPQNAFKPDLPVRIFRRTGLDGKPTGIRFWGVVHEHPEIRINYSVGQSIALSDIHIAHFGYLTEAVRRQRFERNISLMFRDRIKYPDRVLGKFLMIRDWVHLARYDLERNGRQMSGEAAQYLESAIAAFQKDFLGQTHVMALDGLIYYNEALQHLGRGFEVNVAIKVGGIDGLPHEIAYSGRVASPEDLSLLVNGGARDLASIWHGEYV